MATVKISKLSSITLQSFGIEVESSKPATYWEIWVDGVRKVYKTDPTTKLNSFFNIETGHHSMYALATIDGKHVKSPTRVLKNIPVNIEFLDISDMNSLDTALFAVRCDRYSKILVKVNGKLIKTVRLGNEQTGTGGAYTTTVPVPKNEKFLLDVNAIPIVDGEEQGGLAVYTWKHLDSTPPNLTNIGYNLVNQNLFKAKFEADRKCRVDIRVGDKLVYMETCEKGSTITPNLPLRPDSNNAVIITAKDYKNSCLAVDYKIKVSTDVSSITNKELSFSYNKISAKFESDSDVKSSTWNAYYEYNLNGKVVKVVCDKVDSVDSRSATFVFNKVPYGIKGNVVAEAKNNETGLLSKSEKVPFICHTSARIVINKKKREARAYAYIKDETTGKLSWKRVSPLVYSKGSWKSCG